MKLPLLMRAVAKPPGRKPGAKDNAMRAVPCRVVWSITGESCQIWPENSLSEPVGITLATVPTEMPPSWSSESRASISISPPLAIVNNVPVPALTVWPGSTLR